MGNNEVIEYLFGNKLEGFKKIKYIAVTSSSHRIIKSFYEQGLVRERKPTETILSAPYILFDNYLSIEKEDNIKLLEDNTHYILICDAISSGNLVLRLNELIQQKSYSKLLLTAVLVNTIDESFKGSKDFLETFRDKLLYLYQLPLVKRMYSSLEKKDFAKNLIRINPFTNLPIVFKESTTFTESIIYYNQNKRLLDSVDDEDINIRFQIHNNLVHPYYFNISNILNKEKGKENNYSQEHEKSLITKLFENSSLRSFRDKDYLIFYPKESGIVFLKQEALLNEPIRDHSVHFYELERFSTDEGWNFPHSSDYFQKLINDKTNIFILDDGTCSGDSLIQMINELSYFGPNQIDLLCIIGRVNDYKREFFGKLKYLKKPSNPGMNIEVNIFFGFQWHITPFSLNSNPYLAEIKWLKDIQSVQNTPIFIKRNASKILKTITPSIHKDIDYKYFPKSKVNGKVPKKDILLTRNEIGKIIGFRFYKESFDWYNKITFSGKEIDFFDPKQNKNLELISMCLSYEPYLYERMSKSFPDIKYQMEKFIKLILFGDSSGRKIEISSHLYYDWRKNKKDLIHIFFIIFSGYNLLKELQDHSDIIKDIFEFAEKDEKTLDYILYKICYYFPVDASESNDITLKVKWKIQEILNIYPSILGSVSYVNESIKRFNNFALTLPYSKQDNNFHNLYARIQYYFSQIGNEDFHHKGLNNDKTVLISIMDDIDRSIELSLKEDLQTARLKLEEKLKENVYPYIQSILTFSKSYEDYFIIPDDYDSLNKDDETTLRGLQDRIEEVIYGKDEGKPYSGSDLVRKIYSKFFGKGFGLYWSFKNPITNKINIIIEKEISSYNQKKKDDYPDVIFVNNIDSFDININFPLRYTNEILKEIFHNFRHSSEKVIFAISTEDVYFKMDIKASKSAVIVSGTNRGTKLLDKVKKNDIFESDCISNENKKEYNLIITFKTVQ